MASLVASGSASIDARPTPTRSIRAIGLVLGLGIASVFSLIPGISPLGSPPVLGWIVPTLLAGSLSGLVLAPVGWRALGLRSWAGVVVAQGLLAVVVGALGVGMLGSIPGAVGVGPVGDVQLVQAALVGIGLAGIGIILFGWAVLPFTFAAAVLWAVLMAAVRRRLDP